MQKSPSTLSCHRVTAKTAPEPGGELDDGQWVMDDAGEAIRSYLELSSDFAFSDPAFRPPQPAPSAPFRTFPYLSAPIRALKFFRKRRRDCFPPDTLSPDPNSGLTLDIRLRPSDNLSTTIATWLPVRLQERDQIGQFLTAELFVQTGGHH